MLTLIHNHYVFSQSNNVQISLFFKGHKGDVTEEILYW